MSECNGNARLETALEKLMCRVLGDLLQDGQVAKMADDLYCAVNSPGELFSNWHSVLLVLSKANMNLSATKTFIFPKTTIVLDWVCSQAFISASSYCIATLSSCSQPDTVRRLRAFLDADKIVPVSSTH